MEMQDFEDEFNSTYGGVELTEAIGLIDKSLESDNSGIIKGELWAVSLDIEKISALQFTYHLNLYKEIEGQNDIEISLTFENGINNGTALNDYSFDGLSSKSEVKTHRVLIDLEIDVSKIKNDFHEKKSKLILDGCKSEIMEIYSKQNYDNYVTGGGTTKTDSHYNNSLKKYNDRGLFWVCIYEDIEVDRNFI